MTKQTLKVGMIGYNFMGKAHSNAWRQVGRFFDLPVEVGAWYHLRKNSGQR